MRQVVWEFIIKNVDTDVSIILGTITTSEPYSIIKKTGVYQFSEYYGPGEPTVTCPTIPKSIIDWSFPKGNEESGTYIKWTPPPQHCGAFNITANPDNKNVVMTFGSV